MYRRCDEVSDKISEIIDREAAFLTRFRFYTHLMVCSKCRDYFNQFKLLKSASREPNPGELPADFDKVMGFVMDEVEKELDKNRVDDTLQGS